MNINALANNVSVKQEISKVNPKINDLKVARDIFIDMKALQDHDKKMDNVLPAAFITIGVVAAVAGVVAAVAFGVLLTTPFLLPSAMAFTIALIALPLLSWTGFIISVPLIGFSIKGLYEIEAKHKGLKYDQFKDYFNTIGTEKKWNQETAQKNFNLCYESLRINYKYQCPNELSKIIEELNTKIIKAEDDDKVWLNQKLFRASEDSAMLPEDIHNYMASFSSALAAK